MGFETLPDAVCEDLNRIFKGYQLVNSCGEAQGIQVHLQDLPIRQGADEAEDADQKPEPYVIVRTVGGDVSGIDEPQVINLVLLICAYDEDPNRQGYRDTLRIVGEILRHYSRNRITHRRYELQYPIQWTAGEEDTHPYYFAAMSLKFEGRTVYAEEPEL